MKIIPSSKRHYHVARVGVFLVMVALIAGVAGCGQPAPFYNLTTGSTRFTLNVGQYEITTDADGFDVIQMEDFALFASPGDPMLLHKVHDVLLPPDIVPSSLDLKITSTKTRTLDGTYDIKPAAPYVTWADGKLIEVWGEEKTIVDGKNINVYESDASLPVNSIELLTYSQMRKWKFASVDFIPFQYNPVSKKLTLIESVTIEISYRRSQTQLDTGIMMDTVMEDVAVNRFLNYGQAGYLYDIGMPAIMAEGTTYDYVIITTNAIESGSTKLSSFITHKESLGYGVLVVTEDDFGSLTGQAPNHRAEKIRQWLIDNYDTMGIEYVLLIGDPHPYESGEGDIPMKACWTWPEYESERSPTDYFYADLTGNWDLDGDEIYGEWDDDYGPLGGVDLATEVFVGRIPVYDADYATLDSILQKIIDYETEPRASIGWRKSILMPMSFMLAGYDGAMLAEQMKDDFLDSVGFTSWRMYQQGTAYPEDDSIYFSNEELRGGTLVRSRWAVMDFGIVAWWGHGEYDCTGVGYDPNWDGLLMENIDAPWLDDDHPAFTYQGSCDNGYPEYADNLQYAILTNGGIATVGATRSSYLSPSVVYGDFDDYSTCYRYVDRLIQGLPCGKSLYLAKQGVPSLGPAGLSNFYRFNLYGDPSTGLGLTPAQITAVIPNQGSQGQTLDVAILGNYFTGATSVSFGTGITVNSFTIHSSTQITASIFVDPDATLGARDVSVTTPDGTGTLTGGFTVTEAGPTISSVSPNLGFRDATVDVTIGGTCFTAATSMSFGSGITVNGFTVDSSTQITASIIIDHAAAFGARTVTVTTSNGTATLTDGFMVIQPVVSPDGWGWQNPLPQGNSLSSVWGSSDSDVFAVGSSGTIIHYDGSTWSPMISSTGQFLIDVWGISSSDVFAVGGSGPWWTILHYDGNSWSSMDSGTSHGLYGVWASSANDVFAVGDGGTIRHYDGSSWTVTVMGSNLRGIWGTSSSSDVFAVGEDGTILHYDGAAWSPMSSGTTNNLYGVWGTSGSDVYVVGWSDTILHYNGATWSPMSSGTGASFSDVWGTSPSDIFFTPVSGSILHYDGSMWTRMSYDGVLDLAGIWGVDSSHVFAVGADGTIVHYNGSSWNPMSCGITNSLYGVWGDSPFSLFAVGSVGTILRYDGNTWTSMASGTTDYLENVWGSSSSDVFVVGGFMQGEILHYDGTSWSQMPIGATSPLLDVWGSSSSNVFAVGKNGTILRYEGSVWTSMASSTANDLRGIWGSSDSDVFAVGANGTILHYDGGSWSPMSNDTTVVLSTVWGSSHSDVFAVGGGYNNVHVLHYDGSSWTEVDTGFTYAPLHAIWGSSSSDVFFAGYSGTILHYNGSTWSSFDNGYGEYLYDVFGTSANDVFAVGSGGAILHYPEYAPPTIASVNPDRGAQGDTFNAVITGTYFNEVTAVSFGSEITVDSFTVDSPTQITASISINPAATTGTRDVSVTRPSGTATLTDGFLVTYALLPDITSLDPDWGDRGKTIAVTIAGIYFTGATSVGFGPEITVNAFTVDSSTQISANISIEPDATTGTRNISVTTPCGTGTLSSGFTVMQLIVSPKGWGWQNPRPQGSMLFSIWGSSTSGVFAVGESATILHYDGSTWSLMNCPLGYYYTFQDIWGSSPSDIYAVGTGGRTVHYNGSDWSQINTGWYNDLEGVWGSSPEDVFSVGRDGAILHYDGIAWSSMSSGTTAWLNDVWGSSASDVFAVGSSGTILHYDGSNWSAMSSGTTSGISGVWGSCASDVFAVGGGAILHYDGSTWSPMSSGTTAYMYSIWGSSSSDVFAVGRYGTILHYDGSTWSPMSSNTIVDVMRVWGDSSSDVFAVGDYGTILHYDGSAWSAMSWGTIKLLEDVWGSSSSDVFAVGNDGTILYYDGSVWTSMTSGIEMDLYGVWGSSASDVFAVGSVGTILHYDGSTWSPMNSGTISSIYGVWGSSWNDIFAVGWQGTILHFDGTVWSEMGSGTAETFNAIWGSSSLDVFAVGHSGTILHYDGSKWSSMNSGTTYALRDISGTSSSDVFVVGDFGTILHYDGSTWSPMSSGTAMGLTGVWSNDPYDVFMAGNSGVLSHYDGSAWTSMSSTRNDLYGIWGTSYSDMFAVGERGTILHYLEYSQPSVTSVSPNSGIQGETLSSVTITGTYFTGATSVSFGSGITVNSFTVDSSTQITADITISSGATPGTRDVSVTTPGGTATKTGGFTVNPAPPTIATVSPDSGIQGQTFSSVTITGTYLTGATSVSFGSDITVNSFNVDSSTQVTASISISGSAATGARDVSVTTPGGTATKIGAFTVNYAPPTISTVSPDSSIQGQTLDVTIIGTYLTGATSVSFGPEITVNSFMADNSTRITTNITIASGATPGPRDVSITTPGGAATKTGAFTVIQATAQLMEGDVTMDGSVKASDAMFILQYLVGTRTLDEDQLECADTTDDGQVSAVDAMHILQWLVDPDGSLGVLYKPLWQSPADSDLLEPDAG